MSRQTILRRESMKRCRNKKCRDEMSLFDKHKFCPACRYIGKAGLAVGAFLVGVAWGLFQLLTHR